MTSKEFLGKLTGRYLWGNLLAMVLVVTALCLGVKYGLDIYTRHGESVLVPNMRGMNIDEARRLMARNGVSIEVTDSGRNRALPADCILLQTPDGGSRVKEGRVIYVTVNSLSSPMVAIPDIVDNSSLREAEAKLRGLGFTLLSPKYVEGEKDWVLGVTCRGRRLSAGERVPTDVPLALVVGSGVYEEGDSTVEVVDYGYGEGESGADEFEEVGEQPSAAGERPVE